MRTKKLTRRQVINIFKREHPKNETDVLMTGLILKYIDSGAFRNTFRIVGYPLVVKIPIGSDGIDHSKNEIMGLWDAAGKKSVRKFLPTVYYWNNETGVIVMQLYKMSKWTSDLHAKKIDAMTEAFSDEYGFSAQDWDFGPSNVAIEKGIPILVDIGCLLPPPMDIEI